MYVYFIRVVAASVREQIKHTKPITECIMGICVFLRMWKNLQILASEAYLTFSGTLW